MKTTKLINEAARKIKLDKKHGATQLAKEALKTLKLIIKKDEKKDEKRKALH